MMDANRAASDDSRLWDLVARDWIAGRHHRDSPASRAGLPVAGGLATDHDESGL
jgi:hypothetical protein